MPTWKPLNQAEIFICGKNPITSLILCSLTQGSIRYAGAKEAKNQTGDPQKQKLKAGVFLSALNCSPQKNSQLAGVYNCGLRIFSFLRGVSRRLCGKSGKWGILAENAAVLEMSAFLPTEKRRSVQRTFR